MRPVGETALFRVSAIEDMIADRMGRYASGSAREMLRQARTLLRLSVDLDKDYLDRRVRQETAGDYGADDIDG